MFVTTWQLNTGQSSVQKITPLPQGFHQNEILKEIRRGKFFANHLKSKNKKLASVSYLTKFLKADPKIK